MEIEDISELCRLCLESSTILIPFSTPLYFTKKPIPDLIKYCTDIECNLNDGGITPRKVCQTCINKLHLIHEFKWTCYQSKKYLEQIISHSAASSMYEVSEAQSYSPSNSMTSQVDKIEDENSLLIAFEPDMKMQTSSIPNNGVEVKRAVQKIGEFRCEACNRVFSYLKAYKNHVKVHKAHEEGTSNCQQNKVPIKKEARSASLSAQGKNNKKFLQKQPKHQLQNGQSGLYGNASIALHANRNASLDFGGFLLDSQKFLSGDVISTNSPAVNHQLKIINCSTIGGYNVHKPREIAVKKPENVFKPGLQQQSQVFALKKTGKVARPVLEQQPQATAVRKVGKIVRPDLQQQLIKLQVKPIAMKRTLTEAPSKRPGPLSKTKLKAETAAKKETHNCPIKGIEVLPKKPYPPPKMKLKIDKVESVVKGFNEVDITKILKEKQENLSSFCVVDSEGQTFHRAPSDISPSVELIQDVDIFGAN